MRHAQAGRFSSTRFTRRARPSSRWAVLRGARRIKAYLFVRPTTVKNHMRRLAEWLVPPARAVARFFFRIEQTLKQWSKPRLSDLEQWEAWQAHIERISTETTYAFENRLVFRAILKMFENSLQLQQDGAFVFEWLKGVYGRDQVMAVRRELGRDSEVINLIQLMYQIARRPEVISRARYLVHFPADSVISPTEQNAQFDRLCGTGPFIDVAMVKADRNKVERECRAVMKYANKLVAHRTTAQLPLTLKQVHEAMDAIEETLKKYHVILTGSALAGAEPAIQFNWQKAFRIPWDPR